jgi:hypothetical protein
MGGLRSENYCCGRGYREGRFYMPFYTAAAVENEDKRV